MVQELNLNFQGTVELNSKDLTEINGGSFVVNYLLGKVIDYLFTDEPLSNYTGPYPDAAHVADATAVNNTVPPNPF